MRVCQEVFMDTKHSDTRFLSVRSFKSAAGVPKEGTKLSCFNQKQLRNKYLSQTVLKLRHGLFSVFIQNHLRCHNGWLHNSLSLPNILCYKSTEMSIYSH